MNFYYLIVQISLINSNLVKKRVFIGSDTHDLSELIGIDTSNLAKADEKHQKRH